MRALADSRADLAPGALAVLEKDPVQSSNLRTTCVATTLQGGTRVNALPAQAATKVNCRIMPGETVEDTRRWIAETIADPGIEVHVLDDFVAAPASPAEGEGIDAIRAVVERLWPGTPLAPSVSRWATDSRFLRSAGIPAYGLVPIPISEAGATRAHGIDERIPAGGLRQGIEVLHRIVLELAGPPLAPQKAGRAGLPPR